MTACSLFDQDLCRSCRLLETPYAEQLAAKQRACASQLGRVPAQAWLAPVASPAFGFRNKAKMAVAGTSESPILGIAGLDRPAVDLGDCVLYPALIREAFAPLRQFIRACALAPYDIARRRGELKFVLVSASTSTGQLMVRFVLRSRAGLPVLRRHLPGLLATCPAIRVVSANIQPVPMAVIEGEEEILLTGEGDLEVTVNGLPLYLRPGSFFQTNDVVAAELYRQAQDWLRAIQPNRVWDLFCGVGGFALHAAHVVAGQITGIEISDEAIAAARRSAAAMDLHNVAFRALAADAFTIDAGDAPDVVIVNPPRRGIGGALCRYLNGLQPVRHLVYSSCNPATLEQDLRRLDGFVVEQARVFDMFPHTEHAEVMVLLRRD